MSSESDLLDRLRVKPTRKAVETSRDKMAEYVKRRDDERRTRLAREAASMGPVHRELRKVVNTSPEMSGVLKALSKRPKIQRPRVRGPPAAFRLAKDYARSGSTHLVLTPQLAESWYYVHDCAQMIIGISAKVPAGTMQFEGQAAFDAQGDSGWGTFSCWGAVGVSFGIPDGATLIEFTAFPSVAWNASWMSNGWQQAAGEAWIGQVVQVFDTDWSFIETLVTTQFPVLSFNDYNMSNLGSDVGSTSAWTLSSAAVPPREGGIILSWVWMGGNGIANWGDLWYSSLAQVWESATCGALMADIF